MPACSTFEKPDGGDLSNRELARPAGRYGVYCVSWALLPRTCSEVISSGW